MRRFICNAYSLFVESACLLVSRLKRVNKICNSLSNYKLKYGVSDIKMCLLCYFCFPSIIKLRPSSNWSPIIFTLVQKVKKAYEIYDGTKLE